MLADADVDSLIKGQIDRALPPESRRKLTDQQIGWLDKLAADGAHARDSFNTGFFTTGDSRAGAGRHLRRALGSFYMMLICCVLALPLGVAAAIYLEEFAPKNRWTD